MTTRDHCHGCGRLWSEPAGPACVFMHHADAPQVDSITSLRRERNEARAEVAQLRESWENVTLDLANARAEVMRLRAELEDARRPPRGMQRVGGEQAWAVFDTDAALGEGT